jgi:YfiH family protein
LDITDLPQPNGAFEWLQAAAGPALICRPLAADARHLFSTRAWPLGAGEQRWSDVAEALGIRPSHLVRVRQVHGASVRVALRQPDANDLVEADIIVGDAHARDIGLAVQVADCVPILMVDRRNGAVAAAHAGWRGLAARVPAVAVAAMSREFGSRPPDLTIALGPSIGACCYEVGEDVRQGFDAAGFAAQAIDQWFHHRPMPSARNRSMGGVPEVQRPGHWYFDGWASARDQLMAAGVRREHIYSAELCTASHPGALCSYRRDGSRAGRLAGAIRPGP